MNRDEQIFCFLLFVYIVEVTTCIGSIPGLSVYFRPFVHHLCTTGTQTDIENTCVFYEKN